MRVWSAQILTLIRSLASIGGLHTNPSGVAIAQVTCVGRTALLEEQGQHVLFPDFNAEQLMNERVDLAEGEQCLLHEVICLR